MRWERGYKLILSIHPSTPAICFHFSRLSSLTFTWPLVKFHHDLLHLHLHFDLDRFIPHPGAQPSRQGSGGQQQQRESRILEENGAAQQRRRPRRGKSDPKISQRMADTKRQASESAADNNTASAPGGEKTQQTSAPQNDFFPEKTGALVHHLRF